MKNFRLDIILSLTTPITIAVLISLFYLGQIPSPILMMLYGIALLSEVIFLYEKDADSSSDKGIISGLITSTVLSSMLLLSSKSEINVSSLHENTKLLAAAIIFLGIFFRFWAKVILGKMFSHSIRINKEHVLITTGPYKKIRHPAYLGTILIVFGSSLFINLISSYVLFIIIFGLSLLRIKKEEEMLLNRFGKTYKQYKNKTNLLVPWIL